MSAKEKAKAKELIDKMYNPGFDGDNNVLGTLTRKQAKQCALIAVDEIIEVVESAYHKLGCGEIGELKDYIPYIFWQKVKIEIEKL